MDNSCLKIIINTVMANSSISRMFYNYLSDTNTNCNVNQIFIIHFLMEHGGTSAIYKIEKEMRAISKNSTYNIQNLVYDEYLTKKNGREVNSDARCEFITITDKGRNLYKNVCNYTVQMIGKLSSTKGWTTDTFDDYLNKINDLRFISK